MLKDPSEEEKKPGRIKVHGVSDSLNEMVTPPPPSNAGGLLIPTPDGRCRVGRKTVTS